MTEPSTGKGNEGGIRFRDFNAETGLYAGDAHCILQLADGRLARRVHALPAEKGHVIELSTGLRDCKGTEIFENNIIEAVETAPIPESPPREQRDIMKRMEAARMIVEKPPRAWAVKIGSMIAAGRDKETMPMTTRQDVATAGVTHDHRDGIGQEEANEHRKLYAEAVSKLLAFRGKERQNTSC